MTRITSNSSPLSSSSGTLSQPANTPASTNPLSDSGASNSAPGAHASTASDSFGASNDAPQHSDVHGLSDDSQATRRTLRTFFAPYDKPIEQDLALINEIIEAKKADPRQFADGQNPYSIKYAVYNLRHPKVIESLAEAQRQGVDVQVLIEDSQLDPAKDWNTADEQLIAAGFQFSKTHRGLSEAQRQELDLIGIQGSGLMHLKTRIFSRPDPQGGAPIEKVLTGSFNPGDAAPNNNETLHLISDPQLISRYKAKYDAVLADKKLANQWDPQASVNVLFTPTASGPRVADKILELVDNEQEAIFISVFSLRNIVGDKQRGDLVNKLKAARKRGVSVTVVTDRKQSDGVDANGNKISWDDKTEDLLQAAGIPVYECSNTAGPYNAMHNKSAIFGLSDMKVVSDCGNWTRAAMGKGSKKARNDESFLFIDSKKLDGNLTGRRYLSNFLNLLRTYEGQQQGQPSARELINNYSKLPGWPKVKVNFDVMAKTYWGQEVYITGNNEALGDWTRNGPGLKLNTSGGTYPLWSSSTELELPFGLSLEYKVVKRDSNSGELQWEKGPNSLLLVDSGDLRSQGVDLQDSKIKVTDKFD